MLLTRRSLLKGSAAVMAAAAVPVVLTSAVRAGGFVISADLPRASHPAELQECALVVVPGGCHGPGSTVEITLEGVQNGKRVTRTLKPVAVEKDSYTLYGVRRDWPAEGRWVISVVATSPHTFQPYKNREPFGTRKPLRLIAYIPIGADGAPETRATPGGRYERHVNIVRTGYEQRWATLAALLRPEATVAAAR
jgi:hypothetical protein